MGECVLKLYYVISERFTALDLLKYSIKQEYGITELPEIARTKHGKPYFPSSNIKFNYSHCKAGVACIVAVGREVGVDIQEIRKVRPAVIERVCCDNELKQIKTDEDFIRIWTLKEAYSKFTGRGFSEGFKSIDTTTFPDKLVVQKGDVFIAYYNHLT
jgi:4'-phosphopantetheinyl transferase